MPWSVLKWYLTQNCSPAGVDPRVGVAGVAVHVAPGLAGCPGRPSARSPGAPTPATASRSPTACRGRAGCSPARRFWLRMKCWNFIGSRMKKTGVLLPTMSRLPSRGVELHREPARVTPGVGAAPLAGHRGEPDQHLGLGARLEHRRPGVGAHVPGDPEGAERPAALGVRLALRDPLPVEIGHLLHQVVVLQQDRAIRSDGQRMLHAGDGRTAVRRGGAGLGCGHDGSSR